MSEKYKPVKGDRVRVVLEGEVVQRPDYVADFAVLDEPGGLYTWIQPEFKHVVSIEKIEPPVTIFQPGDVLRGLGVRTLYITLTTDGYVNHRSGFHYTNTRAKFTSEHYEKVSLG